MAARGALGAVCRRLWQAGTGQARGTGRAGRDSATESGCQPPLWPSGALPDFILHLGSLQEGGKKGAGFISLSHGVKRNSGKDRNKKEDRVGKDIGLHTFQLLPSFHVCRVNRGLEFFPWDYIETLSSCPGAQV